MHMLRRREILTEYETNEIMKKMVEQLISEAPYQR